ncbi:MAG: CoA transferase [Anaerolineae bacterium]|jgi:crotonobetainyl-CoA:carnitine CoA-transferase CaiB-like acyl-CoA transferase
MVLQSSGESPNGALAGLSVIDAGTTIAGPMAASFLGDFGADVVKIELPGRGDPTREWAPKKDGVSLWWKVSGRNKKMITLNLSKLEGQKLFKRLIADTDIIIENFRPGTLERWNVGYHDLVKVNPGIVMVRISGYGQNGPYSHRPGYGTIAEAMSGIPSFTGFPDKPPTLSAFPLADAIAALFGAMGAMFAIYRRDVAGTGEGQYIDVSLYEPLFRLVESFVIAYDQLGVVKQRRGNRMEESSPRNAYETLDKEWVAISASSQRTFERLAEAIGRPELPDDPEFADNPSRVANDTKLDAIIGDWFQQFSLDDAMDILQQHDVVAGPVYSIRRILEDPHYQAREDIVEIDDPDLGPVRMQNVIPKMSKTPGQVRFAGMRLGAHNHEVYTQRLGLSEEEIERLQADGVI